jgi:Bacterial regulatory protein, Fis family
MEDAERKHFLATLKQTKWVIAGPRGAAKSLGMKRSTVYSRMKKLGIVRSSDGTYATPQDDGNFRSDQSKQGSEAHL